MRKEFYLMVSAIILSLLLMNSCEDSTKPEPPPETPAPEIASVSPDSAKVGDVITITGKNFGETRGESFIEFNGTKADGSGGYGTWNDTKITVKVPTGATTGELTVTVGEKKSDAVNYIIYKEQDPEPKDPVIKSLDKQSAKAAETITITGENFGAERGTNFVSFNDTKADSYVIWADNSIKLAIPSTLAAGIVKVSVTVNGKTSNQTELEIIEDVVLIPEIESITPDKAKTGEVLTITGSNFGKEENGYVEFTGAKATAYTSWTDTEIKVTVPEGAQTGKVYVMAGGEKSNEVDFTLDVVISPDAPQIKFIDHPKIMRGSKLGIEGKNFGSQQGDSYVTIGPAKATTYTMWVNSKIVCVVPEDAQSGDVIVYVNGEASNAAQITIDEGQVIPDYLTMKLIPNGTFTMGPWSDGAFESPAHQVTISYDFYMSDTEISQEQYEEIMNHGNPSKVKNPKNPVEQVTWYKAIDFCNRLSDREERERCYTVDGETVTCNFNANGYRLPTEAEWEYACLGGSDKDPSDITQYGWTLESTHTIQEVGQKSPNPYGLYDLYGNVYEWCWDNYSDSYYSESPSTDPTGPTEDFGLKVIRGGSVNTTAALASAKARASYPYKNDNVNWDLGFRVVRKK